MHDGTVADGDTWLRQVVPAILATGAWQDRGVLIITWDEGRTNEGCCGVANGGHVPTLVVAAAGKRGYRSAFPYTHYSVLRTIEAGWGLDRLGHAADTGTNGMLDFVK
jgi:acid phosphatase